MVSGDSQGIFKTRSGEVGWSANRPLHFAKFFGNVRRALRPPLEKVSLCFVIDLSRRCPFPAYGFCLLIIAQSDASA